MNRVKFQIAFLGICLTALVFACKHKEEAAPEPQIYFTGITPTDENGQSLGTADPTDWRLDDVWVAQEKSLFPEATRDLSLCSPDAELEAYPILPNPMVYGNVAFFYVRNKAGLLWRLRLVDEDFKVLIQHDSLPFGEGLNSVALDFKDIPNDTLRLYYQTERGGCVLRGHGDIIKL